MISGTKLFNSSGSCHHCGRISVHFALSLGRHGAGVSFQPSRWAGVEASSRKENHRVTWVLEIVSPFRNCFLSVPVVGWTQCWALRTQT